MLVVPASQDDEAVRCEPLGAVLQARLVPPAASSPISSVDRPTPLGAVSSGVAPGVAQAEAWSGARPRLPAHQRTGYCMRTARASRWNRDRNSRAAARSRVGG